jgi:hypothetical protein
MKTEMRKKRGSMILPENMVNLVAGLLCLVILIGVVFLVIYDRSQNKSNLDIANSSLSKIMESINNKETKIVVWNVYLWDLLSSSKGEKDFPKQCSDHNWLSCLCMCEGYTNSRTYTPLKMCDIDGICIENTKGGASFSVIGKLAVWNNLIHLDPVPLALFVDYNAKTISKITDLEAAGFSLSDLINTINQGNEVAQVTGPSGWLISSYPQERTTGLFSWIGIGGKETYLPALCSTQKWSSCICIHNGNVDDKSKSVCQQSSFNIPGDGINIKDNLVLSINKNIIQEKK